MKKRIALSVDGAALHSWWTPLDAWLSFVILIMSGQAISDAIRYSELLYTPPWSPGLLVSLSVDLAIIGVLLLVRWAHRAVYRHRRNQEAMWRRL